MIRLSEKLSLPGGMRANEDAVGSGETYIFVLDGATVLGDRTYMDDASDAAWLVHQTAAALERDLPDESLGIDAILAREMQRLLQLWRGPADALPSAGIAVFRLRGDKLEYFGLGDCSADVMHRDGMHCSWEEEALQALDAAALSEAMQYREETGCSAAVARKHIQPTLIRNRALRNQPGGYWCLDPSGVGIAYARCAQLPADACASLFLCSDGFAQLIGFGEAEDPAALHEKARAVGLASLAEHLFALQEADADLRVLPRFKLRDDTSAVLAELELSKE